MRTLMYTLFIPLFVLGGCKSYTEKYATFTVYNRSSDRILVIVDGVPTGDVIPSNGTGRLSVKVMLPNSLEPSAPQIEDVITTVSVAVSNLDTKKLTQPSYCQAGMRLKTSVTYEKDSWGDRSYCTSMQ